VFGHSINRESLAELKIAMADQIKDCKTDDYELGTIVGTHTGPGVVGLAFIAKGKS